MLAAFSKDLLPEVCQWCIAKLFTGFLSVGGKSSVPDACSLTFSFRLAVISVNLFFSYFDSSYTLACATT